MKAPAGVGKTSLVIEMLKASFHKRVEIYVPSHVLAEEVHAKLSAEQVTAQIIVGRTRELQEERTMCRKPQLADAIARLGYPVFPIICMGAISPGNKYTFRCCEHYTKCDYLAQFETDARVLIYTHAYLPLPRNSKETEKPALVVIDESFLFTCLSRNEIARGQLVEMAREDVVVACVVGKLLRALDKGGPILDALRSSGLTAEILEEVSEDFSSAALGFTPYATDEETLRNLTDVPLARFDLVLKILAAELATARSQSHGIVFDSQKQILRLQCRKPITRFCFAQGEPQILILDANADPELIRQWFPEAAFEEIRVERNAYVTQCSSIRGSTVSFVPEKNADPDSAARAERNIAAVQELIDRESEGGRKSVLVVGPQVLTGNASKGVAPRLRCPPKCALAHFNGLRGVDAYKNFDTVIVIGRNQPAIDELENLARALWYDSETPLIFADDFVRETRGYRFKDPSTQMGVEVLIHPDPRIQALHEQIREGESTQAIDRIRLVHAKSTKRVIVLSNLPLDLEVDELLSFDDLCHGTRLEQAWRRLRGVMPLAPAWLAQTFPDLWRTAAAAKEDVGQAQKEDFLNSITIRNFRLLTYEYRVRDKRGEEGRLQTRHSHALSSRPLHQAHAELTRLLGRPVILREVVDGIPSAESFGATGAAQLPALSAQGSAA